MHPEDAVGSAWHAGDMAAAGARRWFSRTGSLTLGWLLVVVGIPLMPLPGPGTIVLVAGVAILSRHYTWAARVLDPLEAKAVEAARYGVATWPRIGFSFLGGVWLMALAVVWTIDPRIPRFEVLGVGLGPHLPAGGWGTGLGLAVSAIAAWALLAYSVKRWRGSPDDGDDDVDEREGTDGVEQSR